MECSDIAGVYKRRKPQEASLWKLLDHLFIEFEEGYDDLFRQQYCFYRPVISHVVRKYLECGDLHQGRPSLTTLAYLPESNVPTAIMNLSWPTVVVVAGSVQVAITKRLFSLAITSKRRFFTLSPIGNMYFPFQKF